MVLAVRVHGDHHGVVPAGDAGVYADECGGAGGAVGDAGGDRERVGAEHAGLFHAEHGGGRAAGDRGGGDRVVCGGVFVHVPAGVHGCDPGARAAGGLGV